MSENSAPRNAGQPVYVTVFTNDGNRTLSKSITYKDGIFAKVPAADMVTGTFETISVDSIEQWANVLTCGHYRAHQAVSYGINATMRGIVAAADMLVQGRAPAGALSRTRANFPHRQGLPGIFFADIDPPEGVSWTVEDVDALLVSVCPWLAPIRRFYVPSASGAIYAGDVLVSPQSGYHMHFVIDDASKTKAIGQAIFMALCEAGHGHIKFAKNGARLVRTCIDAAVWDGERLDFCFGPELGEGLVRRPAATWFGHQAQLHAGSVQTGDFDHWKGLKRGVYNRLKEAAKAKSDELRAIWEGAAIAKAVEGGMDPATATETYRKAHTGVLGPEFILYTKDGTPFKVRDLLADPKQWHGFVMRDPIEPDYGSGDCAKAYLIDQTDFPTIHSLAHGGASYRLEMPYDLMFAGRPAQVPVGALPVPPGQTPAPPVGTLAGGVPVSRADFVNWITSNLGDTDEGFKALTETIPQALARSGLGDIELDMLCETIRKQAKVTKALIRKTIAKAKAELSSEEGGQALESLDLGIARDIIDREYDGGKNIIFTDQALRYWNGGFWEEISDHVVKKQIHDYAEARKAGDQVTRNTVESCFAIFKTEAFRKDVTFDKGDKFINVKNGELHFVDGAWQLRPAKREHFRTSQIPIVYDPNATAPIFEAFLRSCFEGDSDANNKFRLILEMMGYTMITITIYDRFILLLGKGANGKSVVMAVMAAMLGTKSVCAVQPSKFDNAFQRGHMLDKLANIVTELDKNKSFADGVIKNLVSGEVMTAEHKHKPPFEFRNHATMWFGANELPKVDDFSDGTFRRALIVKFNRAFGVKGQRISGVSHRIADADADPSLREIERGGGPLAAELPGILNMCLAALANVFTIGRIESTPSGDAVLKDWAVRNDQVSAFVEDACLVAPNQSVWAINLYYSYLHWAKGQAITMTLSQKSFFERLIDAAPVTKTKDPTTGNIYYSGIIPKIVAMAPPVGNFR